MTFRFFYSADFECACFIGKFDILYIYFALLRGISFVCISYIKNYNAGQKENRYYQMTIKKLSEFHTFSWFTP